MAYDKVIDSSVLDSDLTSIADAIREKAELTDSLEFPQEFVDAIRGIVSGSKLLGYEYRAGSFTLSEDTTNKLTIDFEPFEKASIDYIVVLWLDILESIENGYDIITDGGLSVGISGYRYAGSGIVNDDSAASFSKFTAIVGTQITASGKSSYQTFYQEITRNGSNFIIPFSTTSGQDGKAGAKYNWLLLPYVY